LGRKLANPPSFCQPPHTVTIEFQKNSTHSSHPASKESGFKTKVPTRNPGGSWFRKMDYSEIAEILSA